MPEEPKKAAEVKEEKTIDLDTSGPDVEVTLPEEKDKSVAEEQGRYNARSRNKRKR